MINPAAKRNVHLEWISWNLLYWCNQNSVLLEEEYKFHPQRNWRFDWAIPALKIAIEYEGGIFMPKSGHSSAKGMTRDTEKYNSAQALGWMVLRFTALNYKNLVQVLNNYQKQISVKKLIFDKIFQKDGYWRLFLR